MMSRKRTWLDSLFGPWVLRVLGIELPERPTLEVIAGTNVTISAVDNPTTDSTELTISSSGGGGASTVAAGDGVRVTNAGSAYTVHGVRGTCSLEQFGAVGDGTTNDSAAMTAALAAIAAGTYGTLILGAKTYFVPSNFTVPNGCTIKGQGWKSVLKTNVDGTVLQTVSVPSDVHFHDFAGLGNNTGAAQRFIQWGIVATGASAPSRGTMRGIKAESFAQAGFLICQTNQEGPHAGLMVESCFAKNCTTYGFWYFAGEYTTLIGCGASGCGTGAYFGATGNLKFVGCDFSGNTDGVNIAAGGNDAHGTVIGCTINHCTGNAITIAGATNLPFEFIGCFVYDGSISLTGTNSLVTFTACELAPKNVTNAGRLRLVSSVLLTTYFVAATESGNGWTEVVNCRGLDDSSPTWLTTRVQRDVSFASDANKALTAQESVAQTVIVAAGTITASRQLTNYFAPAAKREQRVINNTAFDLTFKWSSGTTVTIPTGKWAVVGSDGTNAILLESPGGTAGVSITGTGFAHVTSGVLDGAAATVNLNSSADVQVPGGANAALYSNGANAVIASTSVRVAGAYVTTTGAAAISTGFTIANSGQKFAGLNVAGTGDLSFAVATSSNGIVFGDTNAVGVEFNVSSTGYTFKTAGTSRVTLDGSTLAASIPITSTTTVTGSSSVVGGSTGNYKAEIAPLTGSPTNYGALYCLPFATSKTSGNPAVYGSTADTFLNAPTTNINFAVAGATILAQWNTTALSFAKPRQGFSAPYASDSQVTIAVGASTTLAITAAQYSKKTINLTGGTATCSFTGLPLPASEDASYEKIIRWQPGAGGNGTLTLGSGQTLALSTTAAHYRLWMTPLGIFGFGVTAAGGVVGVTV